ncbi:MAG: hypothetical protein HND27_10135 [Bacteroidetes bacterium]|nr:hypothetical protein [Bacteroidota bacterium]MBV6461403.1 hypothetical protein [Flavobacteriales bacterium]WKZ75196.1 MAG: hypothetical protein QY303_13730 [Vicingaceae bacterium]MCL4817419.1 hypothetical protein [Flavobacteriales bacterium]NOG96120.1 hypothetical protein [Bacteroidota bacterium]
MHKPKFKKLLFLFLVLASLWPTACTKRYEEDPFTMHFVRMRKRIIGEWHIKKILIDSEDYTHLLYMDTVPFYSTYICSEYTKYKYWTQGRLEVRTIDNEYKINTMRFVFEGTKFNTIYFELLKPTMLKKYTYGPLNEFGGILPHWAILKLTKKEMHLGYNEKNKLYEIYFEKI